MGEAVGGSTLFERPGYTPGMALPARALITEAEYLAFDAAHEGRHEFVNGEIIAMAGVSVSHSIIAMNTTLALGAALKGGPCRPHGADLRVLIDETGLYAYPDITVVCGEVLLSDTNPPSVRNPTVIIEVLSESTESYDRGAKLEHYRRRASVQCVLLIDSRQRGLTRYTRNADGSWTLYDFTDGTVGIDVLRIGLSMSDLYAGAEGAQGWG